MAKMVWRVNVVFLGVVIFVSGATHAASQFSGEQRTAIQNLRESVATEMPSDFMKEDVYLAKWLAEKDFNVEEARRALQENAAWWRTEKIDSILEENFEDMASRFPYTRDTLDKSGRPVLFINLGQWDIANYFSQPDATPERLGRYFTKMIKESDDHTRQLRSEGRDVSQFNLLVNLGGYSNEKHACFQCLQFYPAVGQVLAAHFPHATAKNIFVNTPFLFRAAFSMLSDKNQDSIQLFGQDQNQWEPMVLRLVDPNQMPGGLLESQALAVRDNSEGLLEWNKDQKKDVRVIVKVVSSEGLPEARAKSKEEYSSPVTYSRPVVYKRRFSNYKKGYRKGYHYVGSGNRRRYRKRVVYRRRKNMKIRRRYRHPKKYSGTKKNYPILKNSVYQWPGKSAPVIYPLSYL